MKVEEIVESFKYNNERKLQEQSIIEARKNKEAVTEKLLETLNEVTDDLEFYAERKNYVFPLYAMYLLAEFREKKAFPIILRFISNENQENVDSFLGDVITEDLKRILASTFDGNLYSLYNIITNFKLDEYIRCAAFDALDILQENNIIKQEEVVDMIDKMLKNELIDDDSLVITVIVTYIMEHKIYDKIELVKQFYKECRVKEGMIGGYDSFIDEVYGNKEPWENKELIQDSIELLSHWQCFKGKKELPKEPEDFDKEKMQDFVDKFLKYQEAEAKKLEKERKSIGRNDPCYCGSGRKYKHCCIDKDKENVVTPADIYINKSLKDYPKDSLKKVYNEDLIEIDEKLYRVLKHKQVPITVERNYGEETRRNEKDMNEAIELIKAKCEKDNINTMEEFDDQIAIHYTFEDIIDKYFRVLDKTKGIRK